MSKVPVLFYFLFSSFVTIGQKTLSEGARMLFKNTQTKLTTEEQNKIFIASGLALSKDKKQFVIANDAASIDYPFDATVLPTDINNDGKEDVFIVFGNSYTSGMAGTNILLFIKDGKGNYRSNFGFSGTAPDIMPTKNLGYPDLLIGGPGFEFPIWRWNGKEYSFHRKITEKNLSKLKTISTEEASKLYVKNLK